MRKKGEITIKRAYPINANIIVVSFIYKGKRLEWHTESWRSGKNKIPYSTGGETFKVSFTMIDDVKVKNLRILKS